MNELRNYLEELRKAEEETTKALEAWEQDPINKNLEKLYDSKYNIEHKIFCLVSEKLATFINSDIKTARALLTKKRTEIYKLFN